MLAMLQAGEGKGGGALLVLLPMAWNSRNGHSFYGTRSLILPLMISVTGD